MSPFAPNDVLRDVTQATEDRLQTWKRGVYVADASGRTIEELHDRAAADRWKLGRDFLSSGRSLKEAPTPRYRDAISRYYYSMYHSARAVVYFHNFGDDFQEHSKLPSGLPGDFPDKVDWSSKLKNARLERNRADYEPYPKSR